MTRQLRVVDGGDSHAVFEALRDALAGGPAVLPHPGVPEGVPASVRKRVAVVVETSGSTGRPKRVALGADALLASSAASESALGGRGTWLLALPAHYIAGINVLTRSLAAETEPVMMPAGRFDPFALAVAAETFPARTPDAPARFTSLVPSQLARLLEVDELLDVLRDFDRILVGGQAMPQQLLAKSLEAGLNVTRTYGSSETSGGCVYDGRALSGVRVAVTDGQVELGGPTLAEGYLGDQERTDAAFFVRDGIRWYRTGDTGEIVDGVLRVTGRLDDLIKSGGITVSLARVERAVRALPGLGEAVVVAAPSDRWGFVPVVVSLVDAELEQVRAAVAGELGAPARPERIIVVAEIPHLPSGKADRAALGRLVAEHP
ncbi:AMP-binding protein [Homoserinimonas sp. A447]